MINQQGKKIKTGVDGLIQIEIKMGHCFLTLPFVLIYCKIQLSKHCASALAKVKSSFFSLWLLYQNIIHMIILPITIFINTYLRRITIF